MTKSRSLLLWIISGFLMFMTAYYQRTTGPTYEMKGKTVVDNKVIKYVLPRSAETGKGAQIKIDVPDQGVIGIITTRRFRSNDEWTSEIMKRDGDVLSASLRELKSAGKMMYKVTLVSKGKRYDINTKPTILRYKDHVPMGIVYPHVILIFVTLIFVFRSGFEAYYKGPKAYSLAFNTMMLMILGGMIFGPLMQYYAFGALWTGWPFGHDLTDNKTLIALLSWVLAWWKLRKDPTNTKWALIAAIVTFAIYMVPHSVLGSEIDYTKTEAIKTSLL